LAELERRGVEPEAAPARRIEIDARGGLIVGGVAVGTGMHPITAAAGALRWPRVALQAGLSTVETGAASLELAAGAGRRGGPLRIMLRPAGREAAWVSEHEVVWLGSAGEGERLIVGQKTRDPARAAAIENVLRLGEGSEIRALDRGEVLRELWSLEH